jgi:putative nucleotidyltransferase with HDIG domain
MIKKVKVADLRVGMYIHSLNVSWLEHGFGRNRFLIQNEKQIEKIMGTSASDVYIDTVKGIDEDYSPTLEEAESELMEKVIQIATEPEKDPIIEKLETKWAESRNIQAEASKTVSKVLNDVRVGKQVSIVQATPVVMNITDAVLGNDGTLVSLCRIKQRDDYLFQHSVSVSALLVTFCHSIGGFSNQDLLDIGLGGMFHDIGKMKIPSEILNKQTRLTEEEFAIMATHVPLGIEYLRSVGGANKSAIEIVGEHHERYDGTGYPRGVARNAISLLGQMASIVDVYDAITSVRAYPSKALEPSDALKRLFEWAGKHFNQTLVQKFIKVIGIYPVGSLVKLECGRLAVVLRQDEDNLLKPLVRIVFDTNLGHQLPPQDLNLASPGCQDHVTGYELPSKWGIDPFQFVGKTPLF